MWMNKKYGKKQFKGSYVKLKGERVFELTFANKEVKTITFESWQMAKKLGWVKVNAN